MKREHDTEPGPPDLSDESSPTSQAKPRQVTARGLGAPSSAPAPSANEAKNDSEDFTSDTTTGDRAEADAPAFLNDSMDRALDAIGNRRRRVPVSREEGRSEHVPLRMPPSSNDTLPVIGKVVVDTRTEPGARQLEALLAPAPQVIAALPERRQRSIVIVLGLCAVALLLLAVGFFLSRDDRSDAAGRSSAPSTTARGSAPIAPAKASSKDEPSPPSTPPAPSQDAPPMSAVVPSAAPNAPPAPPRSAAPKGEPRPQPSSVVAPPIHERSF